jgi:diketogulonate reductase-like aldo/keto reductase
VTNTASVRAIATGIEMPMLGFGVFRIDAGRATEEAVGQALAAGYRHVDTAQAYGNETSVGRAVAAAGVPREAVFVTTKFLPANRDPVEAAKRSIERLGLDQVDLYLVHFPKGGPMWAWRGMERALELGLTRGIGVSNFDRDEIDAVIAAGDVPPAVNQIMLSPFTDRRALCEVCEEHGVAVEAYSSLTQGRDLGHPVVVEVASRNRRTAAQVLLRWAIQRGFPVIPKSVRRERIVENARIFDFSLSAEDMAALARLDRTGGTARAVEHQWWTLRSRALRRLSGLTESLRRSQAFTD